MNYYAVVFPLCSPYLLCCDPLFEEGKNASKIQENRVSAGGVAIANHCAIVNLLGIVKLLRRSLFWYGWVLSQGDGPNEGET